MNLIDFNKRFPNEDACVSYFKLKKKEASISSMALELFIKEVIRL